MHLTPDQMSECILGTPAAEAAQHLKQCPACDVELANFRAALAEFRGTLRSWSAKEARAALAVPVRPQESRSWIAAHQFALALLLAAVFLLASVAVPWYQRRHAAVVSDAALLNQVDAQVSRTAPSSLEPLMKLVVEKQQ